MLVSKISNINIISLGYCAVNPPGREEVQWEIWWSVLKVLHMVKQRHGSGWDGMDLFFCGQPTPYPETETGVEQPRPLRETNGFS